MEGWDDSMNNRDDTPNYASLSDWDDAADRMAVEVRIAALKQEKRRRVVRERILGVALLAAVAVLACVLY